jgi:hypothetical protein
MNSKIYNNLKMTQFPLHSVAMTLRSPQIADDATPIDRANPQFQLQLHSSLTHSHSSLFPPSVPPSTNTGLGNASPSHTTNDIHPPITPLNESTLVPAR